MLSLKVWSGSSKSCWIGFYHPKYIYTTFSSRSMLLKRTPSRWITHTNFLASCYNLQHSKILWIQKNFEHISRCQKQRHNHSVPTDHKYRKFLFNWSRGICISWNVHTRVAEWSILRNTLPFLGKAHSHWVDTINHYHNYQRNCTTTITYIVSCV